MDDFDKNKNVSYRIRGLLARVADLEPAQF